MLQVNELTNAHEYCEQETKKSGSSFYYSFLFLPKEQKQAIIAVYAFCREIDDIVDECSDQNIAKQKLFFWQEELNKVYAGTPNHPVAKALQQVINTYNLPKIWFEQIIEGMFMDLTYQGYATFNDLNVYCHNVASTVGMLSASIFGYKEPNTIEFAKKLGLALQYINIIRDVGADARLNRIYLPEELMSKFDLNATEILKTKLSNNDNLKQALEHMATLANNLYLEAMSLLSPNDIKSQNSALIMADIYLAILNKIKKQKFSVLDKKINITPIHKLFIAWKRLIKQ